MHFYKKLLGMSFCFIALQSCSQVDDYILGKDNTPKPKELTEIKSKVNMDLKWSTAIGKSSKSSAYLKMKPVIQGEIIYTADTSGLIQAVNRNSGSLVWSTQLKHGVVSGPTVKDGYIVVGTNASTVALLKQSNGQELWQVKLSEDALSKSVISNHKVIVKTIDGNLYAFDLGTGEKIWVSDHGAPNLILKASSSPVVMGNLVLVGFSDGKLDAVDINTGRLIWQRSIAYATGASDVERLVDIDADPIVRGQTVYLASYQGYVGALNLADGQFIWNKPASIYKNMAIDANTLYLTDSNDILWAIDRQNGHVKWKQVALKARGLTDPVLMGNHLLVGDRTGYLHVVAIHSGELIGRTQLNGTIDLAPVVSGRHVYVVTANGKLNSLS